MSEILEISPPEVVFSSMIARVPVARPEVRQAFLERLEQGRPSMDENQAAHFCVFFAVFDPLKQEVFLGYHLESGLWLFNGGHVDLGETPDQAVRREMAEELGEAFLSADPGEPKLMTITEIEESEEIPCRRHYDFWFFLAVDGTDFFPDRELLAEEFAQNNWLSLSKARWLVTDPATLEALEYIEGQLSSAGKPTF